MLTLDINPYTLRACRRPRIFSPCIFGSIDCLEFFVASTRLPPPIPIPLTSLWGDSAAIPNGKLFRIDVQTLQQHPDVTANSSYVKLPDSLGQRDQKTTVMTDVEVFKATLLTPPDCGGPVRALSLRGHGGTECILMPTVRRLGGTECILRPTVRQLWGTKCKRLIIEGLGARHTSLGILFDWFTIRGSGARKES